MNRTFTGMLLGALILGAVTGLLLHHAGPQTAVAAADRLVLLGDVFLRLIQMIIAPLVLATLIPGIARLGTAQTIGRIGFKAMLWFLIASAVSLMIGLIMAGLLDPGSGLRLHAEAEPLTGAAALTLRGFLEHVFPTSILDAMARNEILQIVVFSGFAGFALASLGARARTGLELLELLAAVMFKITGYVMWFAPVGVFGAVAATAARQGADIFVTYGLLIGDFYAGLALLWICLIAAGSVVLGRRMFALLAAIRVPALIAFSTASSEAAYPQLLDALERFGIPNRLASFVLPLGYSFNLDGTMMYCSFAVIFLAQVYHVPIQGADILMLMGMLFVTGKGIASVPRGSLIIIGATLPYFHIPSSGLMLILAVDHFMDMGRSGTNIIGNSIATAVVAKFEGMLARTGLNPPAIGVCDARRD